MTPVARNEDHMLRTSFAFVMIIGLGVAAWASPASASDLRAQHLNTGPRATSAVQPTDRPHAKSRDVEKAEAKEQKRYRMRPAWVGPRRIGAVMRPEGQ